MAEIIRPRSSFTVIEGDGQRSPSLLDIPSIVVGKSPFSSDSIVGYRLSVSDIRRALEANRRQPGFDLWSCVIGTAPPLAGVEHLQDGKELIGFGKAYACFRGVLRPVGEDDRGYDVFAFVHKPKFTYTFVPSMSRCVVPYEVADDLVFVTYMKLDYPEGRPYGKGVLERLPVQGIVTHWNFVEADPSDPMLPVDFKERFRKRMW